MNPSSNSDPRSSELRALVRCLVVEVLNTNSEIDYNKGDFEKIDKMVEEANKKMEETCCKIEKLFLA